MDVLDNWQEEKRSAYVYRKLAEIEANPIHQKLFIGLAQMADKQAGLWEEKIHQAGIPSPSSFTPDKRTRLMIWLVRHLGAKRMRLALAAMKVRGMSIYYHSAENVQSAEHLPEIEHQHRVIKNTGNLRAAIFGVSDGLLSNASLMFGVAGAGVSQSVIVLSGVAGLLAGAFSMASGEYVSVRSQRQMLEYQMELERQELELYPEEEAAELALIYEARGLGQLEAKTMANHMIQDPVRALDTLAREELGINPSELGSPWGAAFSSLAAFSIGALVPLIPFIVYPGSTSLLMWSMGLTGAAFFIVGAVINIFTQRSMLMGGLRMLLIGAGIGLLTHFIGSLFGVQMR